MFPTVFRTLGNVDFGAVETRVANSLGLRDVLTRDQWSPDLVPCHLINLGRCQTVTVSGRRAVVSGNSDLLKYLKRNN